MFFLQISITRLSLGDAPQHRKSLQEPGEPENHQPDGMLGARRPDHAANAQQVQRVGY